MNLNLQLSNHAKGSQMLWRSPLSNSLELLYFCCDIHDFTLYLSYSFISRPLTLPPSNADTAKFWDTYSFMHQYRLVHNTTLFGGRVKKMCYRRKHEFVKPAGSFAAKQDFFQKLCPYQNIFVYLFLFRIATLENAHFYEKATHLK